MSTINCISLDFDDTLVDTRQSIIDTLRYHHATTEFYPENLKWWDFKTVFPQLSDEQITNEIWQVYNKEIWCLDNLNLINDVHSVRKFERWCNKQDIQVVIATHNPFIDFIKEYLAEILEITEWEILDKTTGIIKSQCVIDDDPKIFKSILKDVKYCIRFHKSYNSHLWLIPAINSLEDAIPLIELANGD
jgi:hypothetical protein